MEKIVKFEVDELEKIDFDNYSDEEFAIARMGFLSTKPNSHELKISEEVLKDCAKTVLDKWVVADMQFGEPTTHTKNEHIVGKIPKDQSVEFTYDKNGYLRAYVDTVISKIYAKDFCEAFATDTSRAVSVEMTVEVSDSDENEVINFNIVGVTVLGKTVRPSCPDSDINMIRFSQEEADAYFNKINERNHSPLNNLAKECTESTILSDLEKFVENRKKSMAEQYVSHPVNTSKDAIYEGEWDGNKAKQDLVKEKNYKTLAPKVCLRLEPGWEDREVTKLGYPVMGLYDGEWRYSVKALASAQGYAEKENETEVLKKIKAIKKKLGLDDSDGKEETKMAEKDTEKVDMEEETKVDETKETEMEETVVKAEDCPCDEDDKHDTEEHEDFEAKCAQLTKDIEERDNIIMQKDEELKQCQTELAELREYKRCMEASQLACKVEAALSEIKGFASESQIDAFREEGKNCTLENIDAFVNKVKATCFDATKGNLSKSDDGMFKFSIPVVTEKKSESVWDRL